MQNPEIIPAANKAMFSITFALSSRLAVRLEKC